MKNAVVYIHGKGGSAEKALYYKKFFNDDYELLGFNYKSELPWQAGEEFQNYFDSIIPNYNEILLIANSIGAYFSMLSLSEKPIKKALFVSPIVDMENIILHMMKRAKVSEEELRIKKVIVHRFFFGGFPHCVRAATSAVPLSLHSSTSFRNAFGAAPIANPFNIFFYGKNPQKKIHQTNLLNQVSKKFICSSV